MANCILNILLCKEHTRSATSRGCELSCLVTPWQQPVFYSQQYPSYQQQRSLWYITRALSPGLRTTKCTGKTCSNVSQVIHTTCSLQHAVNAKSRVVFLHLASFHFGQCVNWWQTRVFCQCQRYTLQCIREGTECILLQGWDLTNANVTCKR